jgi:hypothetical protein
MPAFVQSPVWQFGGLVNDTATGEQCFDVRAAESGVHYNGFYLFSSPGR